MPRTHLLQSLPSAPFWRNLSKTCPMRGVTCEGFTKLDNPKTGCTGWSICRVYFFICEPQATQVLQYISWSVARWLQIGQKLSNAQQFVYELTRVQGYNGKDLPLIQQDKVCWQNHLLGGWTIQQWRSKVEDCTPTSVEFNLCPADDEGTRPLSLSPHFSHTFQAMQGHMVPHF